MTTADSQFCGLLAESCSLVLPSQRQDDRCSRTPGGELTKEELLSPAYSLLGAVLSRMVVVLRLVRDVLLLLAANGCSLIQLVLAV